MRSASFLERAGREHLQPARLHYLKPLHLAHLEAGVCRLAYSLCKRPGMPISAAEKR